MHPSDRTEVSRLLERAVAGERRRRRPEDAEELLRRGRAALDGIAGEAADEYAAYAAARHAERAGRRTAIGTPALVTAVAAVAACVADLGWGTGAGTALGTAAVVAVAGAATTAARSARGSRAGGGRTGELRRAWLEAVDRRGVRPFLERQLTAPAPAPAPGPALPPQRRTDRSAAARGRSALEQSFAQLPVADGPFTGRRDHLRQIAQWVHQARVSPASGPVVVVLHGPAGSGRTTLAVRAAQQLKDQFRGACVVDLRGAAPGERPLPTRDALLHLLNRLGAPREQLLFRERTSQEQHLRRLADEYQKRLTGVPVVVVLDDAADAGQVRDLVPERSDSLVLVTAAGPLALDVPAARVHDLPLEPLTAGASRKLLAALGGDGGGGGDGAGDGAPDGTAAGAEEIRRLCGGLPLALRIAGSSLPERGVAVLAAELAAYGPLDPVERALALRYHDQPEPARRLLRRLALAGRTSLGAAAAAALLAADEQEAGRRLGELAAAGLIEHVRGSRYRLHDLVRRFAHARLLDEEDPDERAAAQERLIRSYAELADSVIRLVDGRTSTRADRFGPQGFASLDLALRWLDEESSFITAALRHAEGVDQRVVQHLLGALCDYCLLRGDLYRLGEISELAQRHQREADQNVLVRSVQWRTGIAARQLGELDKARSTLSSVVDLYFEAQHPAGAARALCSLGITLQQQGSLHEAEEKLREALELQAAEELRADRAWTQHALAAVLRDAGRLAEAHDLLTESLALHRESESVHGQAWAHLQLGQWQLAVGDADRGEAELRAAGECYAATRDPRGTAWTATQLARARLLRGDAPAAQRVLGDALTRHRANEDARGEAWSLYYLGQALEEAGELDPALRALERSRTMFSRMRDVYGLACARHHSARVTRDQRAALTGNLRNSGFARQLLQDARADFRRIGVPHGEAWSCVELAVIDAGNGRVPEALELLRDAERLFAALPDRRGADWSRFLRCTLLPLLTEDGAAEAREGLSALLRDTYQGRDLDLEEYAEAYALLLERGVEPGTPWEAWRLGMVPSRGARMAMTPPPADRASDRRPG
ncbi:tetratricopeptide repeat protein [Streptomyces sp. NPDC088354]|uniref:tetratricopeptide repeat protein n=1 Tax=Streptomyces sp. NPDC088354 TaxID=3365856 RepID=UPI0038049969